MFDVYDSWIRVIKIINLAIAIKGNKGTEQKIGIHWKQQCVRYSIENRIDSKRYKSEHKSVPDLSASLNKNARFAVGKQTFRLNLIQWEKNGCCFIVLWSEQMFLYRNVCIRTHGHFYDEWRCEQYFYYLIYCLCLAVSIIYQHRWNKFQMNFERTNDTRLYFFRMIKILLIEQEETSRLYEKQRKTLEKMQTISFFNRTLNSQHQRAAKGTTRVNNLIFYCRLRQPLWSGWKI